MRRNANLWAYGFKRNMRISGFVERENIGCAIDAMSERGATSRTSSTKKSRTGWRSGRNISEA
jgi:hypothetical protein